MSERLHDLPARWVGTRANAVAVVGEHEELTYGALGERADRLARLLSDAGVRAGDRVCLLIPKSPDAIVALLGVLRANAVYVPLDTASPAARLARMVRACDDRWILAAPGTEFALRGLLAEPGIAAGRAVGWLGAAAPDGTEVAFTASDLAAASAAPPPPVTQPHDPAHILFTSGSTGEPKGVVVTHASVLAFLRWAHGYFGFQPDDRHSAHPPLHFDLSTFDIFGTLGAGAQLHLVPPGLNLLPHKLAELIRQRELTQWFSVPSVLNLLARADLVREGDFPALRRVLWCGEVLPTPTLQYLMRRLPHARFTNLYGPTEAAIASSYYTLPAVPDDPLAPIPIGTACAGEELLVLDERLRATPDGEVGHLCIRGAGLSPGYWRDPAKTAVAFLPYPASGIPGDRVYRTGDLARRGADGLLYFVGREDTQIKTRGYRVELGEVEAALGAVAGLRESAAVAVDAGGFEGVVIGCAYVSEPGAGITPAAVRTALAARLPPYMLPARWLALEALPRNASGKVDRPALRSQLAGQAAAGARPA